ncbi:DUF1833 family protein [Pantoea sp.]|uniref:DUF1833 family protein n=1 Tax=Pantoea sp. TaxID=69393 RepID=UPI0028B230C7|nr:DUF1833 family protein [Pantoea sp.]
MTMLDRLYASSGSEVLIPAIQITVGEDSYYLTNGFEDISVSLENGDSVTLTACGISVSLPARNDDGTQDLKFAISNITGEASTIIRNAINNKTESALTYRCYISTDLTAPAATPYTMKIKNGTWTNTRAQITAGYMNILDTAWPRNSYTLNYFPGLRYTG